MVKKAIIPIAGLGTRFLPLSKAVPKELWPLVDKPVLQHIIEEVQKAGIGELIFITSPDKKVVFNYFKPDLKVEKILKERKKAHLLEEMKSLDSFFASLKIRTTRQVKPLGDGHAILQGIKYIGDEPFAVLFGDDVVDSNEPCIGQLEKIYRTCLKPVLALARIPKEEISKYGVVKVEKISNRLYKIKEIVEKPSADKAPSDLAIVGKYILTPEVKQYLKKAKPSEKGEIILGEILAKMLSEGRIIYGYEFEGQWMECGTKENWLKSNVLMGLKNENFYGEIRKKLKKNL